MLYSEIFERGNKARVKISIDGEIDVSDVSLILKAASFFYRLHIFLHATDLEIRTTHRDSIATILTRQAPRTLTSKPLNLDLLMNLEFHTSGDIRSALLFPTAKIGVKDGPDVRLEIKKISYASPGFIVIAGIAGAIEAVFKAFAAALDVKGRKLDRRIKEEQYLALVLENYGRLQDLSKNYAITPEEVNLIKAEGSIIILQLIHSVKSETIKKVQIESHERERSL